MTAMVLKDTCRYASALILIFGAITTSAVASAIGEGNDWNMRRPNTHILLRNSHHYGRHHFAPGYAAALPAADGDLSYYAPHFVHVGPNGYWVTGSWGCWVEEAQDRIADCDSGNR
jgi:hypothetical protein